MSKESERSQRLEAAMAEVCSQSACIMADELTSYGLDNKGAGTLIYERAKNIHFICRKVLVDQTWMQ